MKNKVYYVSHKEMLNIKEMLHKDDSLYIVDIDGSDINSLDDYLNKMSELFKFPIPARTLDGYLDWIRDLDWLMKDGYALIINNFSKFLNRNLYMKNKIIEDFEKVVLPWWHDDVEKYEVNGKTKQFIVYLVD